MSLSILTWNHQKHLKTEGMNSSGALQTEIGLFLYKEAYWEFDMWISKEADVSFHINFFAKVRC